MARPTRLQPVNPNSASGASQPRPNGPDCNHAASVPLPVTSSGTNITHSHAMKLARMPQLAASGGVRGRQTAKPKAGIRVAKAENETVPTSASASLPLTRRAYAQPSSMIARMPPRRSSSKPPR